MRRRLFETLLLLGLGAPVLARAQAPVPVQQEIINLSLVETLVAIEATDLAGVFGFIPEERTAMAMADFLVHDHAALKKFVKKTEKDYRQTQGVNSWDKQVLLYLVGIDAAGILPPGAKKIPVRWMRRINELSLVQPLPLEIIVQRRGAKG